MNLFSQKNNSRLIDRSSGCVRCRCCAVAYSNEEIVPNERAAPRLPPYAHTQRSLFFPYPFPLNFIRRYHWLFSSLGPLQIVSIILRATGGLEKRQAERYESLEGWKEYASSTPVFVPGTSQYSWVKAPKKK